MGELSGALTVLGERPLGRRGQRVTALGLGCAPLGNLYRAIDDESAAAVVDAAWEAGIRFFDTAPLYGNGLSERRVGAALARRPRDEFMLCTKVGRLLREPAAGAELTTIFADAPRLDPAHAYSRDSVLRSIEESLSRLGLDRIDVVHVHDPDDHEHEALTGAFPALIELREQGVISAVGCGMNQWQMLDRFVQRVDLDCVLLAGRYTLLDQSGGEVLLPRCVERGVGVVIGGVFNSGLLADPVANSMFDYGPAPAAMRDRARELVGVCAARGVSIVAAAVQFALRHGAVSSVVVGAQTVAELEMDVGAAVASLPADLWVNF
ncbi:MAG: aldo/keto reductase [Actinobacteria bacterium]|nr:aldo/keto reductase [Actinomycetota bacterium]